MSGKHWNDNTNTPDDKLKNFLDSKVHSIKQRILEASSIDIIEPIYYSAEKQRIFQNYWIF